uniref:GM13088p n=1 Tax=Drosophila melanogaster TaxID=7227 RepID=Q95S29_DROME|nr:GM13088p [Drosophila melanogaster]
MENYATVLANIFLRICLLSNLANFDSASRACLLTVSQAFRLSSDCECSSRCVCCSCCCSSNDCGCCSCNFFLFFFCCYCILVLAFAARRARISSVKCNFCARGISIVLVWPEGG